MKFCSATEQDFEWMAEIQKSFGLPLWRPNATSWVLGKDAYAIWQKIGYECELLSLATRADMHGKGYAKELMEFSQEELKKQGVNKYFLEVKESNVAAISLYRKLGYIKVHERKEYYPDGEPAAIMRLINI
ncbi:MAG: GNAT family N-acetyltransferase [Fibromonadaceae bacterium]|jgi:ribosomal protein S18 acetylase RimI-like enzyme|nr:GNAT family N-acetyltransferase [Fibromonadaceae bacterium]